MSLLQELTAELEEKQDIFRSLQDTAELLSLENHPAKQTVEVSGSLGQPRGSQDHIPSPGTGRLAAPPRSARGGVLWWQDTSAAIELLYFGKRPFPNNPHLKLRHEHTEHEPFPQGGDAGNGFGCPGAIQASRDTVVVDERAVGTFSTG